MQATKTPKSADNIILEFNGGVSIVQNNFAHIQLIKTFRIATSVIPIPFYKFSAQAPKQCLFLKVSAKSISP